MKRVKMTKRFITFFKKPFQVEPLEEVMKHDVLKLDIQRFLRDIYEGFEAIRQQGYWFSDFVEKNIFCGR
ncbi:hypothetical protein CCAN2_1290006 [Capnocytophaga canimorsus]|nr:hypothetical protein CCAN2_1290006 [Capnocytophaga canimorsus]